MILFTVQFDQGKSNHYSRLLEVFLQSVKQQMPGLPIKCVKIKAPPKEMNKARNLTYNTEKLRLWIEALNTFPDDFIFIDCDMLCTADARAAFDCDFDIGITFTSRKVPPMNGGVVFVRNNERSRDFMRKWREINDIMYYKDKALHHEWQVKYLGMNQAAFGYLYEKLEYNAKIKRFQTRIWNSVDTDWKDFSEDTKFVHIKSELRRAVISNMEPSSDYYKVMKEWYEVQESLPFRKLPPEALAPKAKPRKLKYRRVKRRGRWNWR